MNGRFCIELDTGGRAARLGLNDIELVHLPEGGKVSIDIDEWLLTEDGQRLMADMGLWHEHPAATKGWAHLQTLPPRSGRRTFYP